MIFLEYSREVDAVLVADAVGNLIASQRRSQQKISRLAHPNANAIRPDGHPGLLFEQNSQMRAAHRDMVGYILQSPFLRGLAAYP
jgi:hypothetical protein